MALQPYFFGNNPGSLIVDAGISTTGPYQIKNDSKSDIDVYGIQITALHAPDASSNAGAPFFQEGGVNSADNPLEGQVDQLFYKIKIGNQDIGPTGTWIPHRALVNMLGRTQLPASWKIGSDQSIYVEVLNKSPQKVNVIFSFAGVRDAVAA